jgi:ribosomal protein L24
MSLADPVGDLLKTENIGVEGCACIDISHKKRDMVEGEMIRHRQAVLVERVRLIGLRCQRLIGVSSDHHTDAAKRTIAFR